MSDTVSRKSLLKFLYANYKENELSQAGKALDYVIKKIESGAFSTESDAEIESLKAITELAVKRMQDLSTHICDITVNDVYFEGYSELKKKAFEYASEIEKLQK